MENIHTKIWLSDTIDKERLVSLVKETNEYTFVDTDFTPSEKNRKGNIYFHDKIISKINKVNISLFITPKENRNFIVFDVFEVYEIADIHVLGDHYYFSLNRVVNYN